MCKKNIGLKTFLSRTKNQFFAETDIFESRFLDSSPKNIYPLRTHEQMTISGNPDLVKKGCQFFGHFWTFLIILSFLTKLTLLKSTFWSFLDPKMNNCAHGQKSIYSYGLCTFCHFQKLYDYGVHFCAP